MKTRIISGAAALMLLAGIMLAGKVVLGVAVFLLAVLGMHEFFGAFEKNGYKPVKIAGYLSCIPLLYLAFCGATQLQNISVYIFVFLLMIFCIVVFSNGRYNIPDISITFLGVIYVVFLFSFATLTRNLENGFYYIGMVFIGAWVTDTFAYFTGVSIGKIKILPVISPKKSLEGAIGGVIGCTALMVVYGFYLGVHMKDMPIYHFIIIGVICGIVSQVGDWTASAMKRFTKIKDFGRIMPGHGGVLDRVDSLLFTAPVVYFYLILVVGV